MDEVLDRFGVTPSAIERITVGGVNEHWHVFTEEGRHVLRRYRPRNAGFDVGFEHAVLAYAAQAGWPVAVPLPARDGETVAMVDGHRYSLFPFLPGEPGRYGDLALLQEKGRLLARLHHDLASFPVKGQRAGFGRITDLDLFVRPDGWASVNELLAWCEGADPALAATIRSACIDIREELERLDYAALPDTAIHFEFVLNSVLFADGALSGLLDFDFVHLDARVVDIGRSIALDCRARDGSLSIEAVCAFLGGYVSESRLSEAEARLLVPAIRATMLWNAVLPLSIGACSDDASMLRSATYTAAVELPALAAQHTALEQAVRAISG